MEQVLSSCLSQGGRGGGTGRENSVWSQASSERPRCSELGVLAGRCVLGQDHATLPRQQFHPCASLSSQETWHYSCEIQISRSTHSRSQLAGRAGAWLQAVGVESHSGHSWEAPGRRFASLSFWEQSPTSREYLWRARCLASVRGLRVGRLWFHCANVCVGSVKYAQVFQAEPIPFLFLEGDCQQLPRGR